MHSCFYVIISKVTHILCWERLAVYSLISIIKCVYLTNEKWTGVEPGAFSIVLLHSIFCAFPWSVMQILKMQNIKYEWIFWKQCQFLIRCDSQRKIQAVIPQRHSLKSLRVQFESGHELPFFSLLSCNFTWTDYETAGFRSQHSQGNSLGWSWSLLYVAGFEVSNFEAKRPTVQLTYLFMWRLGMGVKTATERPENFPQCYDLRRRSSTIKRLRSQWPVWAVPTCEDLSWLRSGKVWEIKTRFDFMKTLCAGWRENKQLASFG